MRAQLPGDIIYTIATHLAPITIEDARTIFSKVHAPFYIGVATQGLNNYLKGSATGVISDLVSKGLSLITNQATPSVNPHHERVSNLLIVLSRVTNQVELQTFLQVESEQLKKIMDKPTTADNNLVKFLEHLIKQLNVARGISLTASTVPVLQRPRTL